MIHKNAKGTGNGLDPDSCGWDCQCDECQAEDNDECYFHCRKTDSLFEMSIARGDVAYCPGCGEPWQSPVIEKASRIEGERKPCAYVQGGPCPSCGLRHPCSDCGALAAEAKDHALRCPRFAIEGGGQ